MRARSVYPRPSKEDCFSQRSSLLFHLLDSNTRKLQVDAQMEEIVFSMPPTATAVNHVFSFLREPDLSHLG